MQISRLDVPEHALEKNLARCRCQQIGAAHDIGDALIRIVDDNAQLIGVQAVRALDDEVADVARQVLLLAALQTIVKSNDGVVDPDAPCTSATRRALQRNAVAACARIDAFAGRAERGRFEVAAGAGALVDRVFLSERRKRGVVSLDSRRLAKNRSVPLESIPFECRENFVFGVAAGAWFVDVIDA